MPEGSLPLLGYVRETTVKNLNIYGVKIAGNGLINNYTVDYGDDGKYDSGCPWTAKIENCTLKAGSSTLQSGFVSGYASGLNTVTITNCTVEDGVTIGYDKQQSGIGSFGGQFNGEVYNCVSYADVYGVDNVGGIVGIKGQSMGACRVQDCVFSGRVEAGGKYAGGIVGSGYQHKSAPNTPCVSILNCYADGSVSGVDCVGGIFGGEGGVKECWGNGVGYIQNNCFYGEVAATGDDAAVGGIIGVMNSLDCYNIVANNYYVAGSSIKKGIGVIGEVLTEGVYARSDDPAGSDSKALSRAVNWESFKNGTVVIMLNRNLGSSGNWVQGINGPEFGQKKHLLNITCPELSVFGGVDAEVGGKNLLADKKLVLLYSDGSQKEVSALSSQCDSVVTAENAGKQLPVSLVYENQLLVFQVNVKGAPAAKEHTKETVTVSFTLWGDSKHGAQSAGHTLSKNNLQVWLPEQQVTVPQRSSVLDVFACALGDAGLVWRNDGVVNGVSGNYIEAIARSKQSSELGEFDNGPNSGWMYTLNGKYPANGVKEQEVQNGDTIIFHYTDDYTQEKNTGF